MEFFIFIDRVDSSVDKITEYGSRDKKIIAGKRVEISFLTNAQTDSWAQ
jgi:hypothetical protein